MMTDRMTLVLNHIYITDITMRKSGTQFSDKKHSKIPRCPKIHQAASDALNLFREIGDRTPA